MTLLNFLRNIKHRIAYLASNFINWQFLVEEAMQCLIIKHRGPYSEGNFAKSSISDVTKV